MGAKKSLTGEEVDPEMKEQQEAQQKLAEAEALANQQNGSVKLYIFGSYWLFLKDHFCIANQIYLEFFFTCSWS